MPDPVIPQDILIPIPEDQRPVNKKPRWHHINVFNPCGGLPSLGCIGETVDLNAAGDVVSTPTRDATLDMTIAFDQNNPLHLQFYELGDEIVKEAYRAKLAAQAAAAAPAPAPVTPEPAPAPGTLP